MSFDLSTYLARIGLDAHPTTLDGLKRLQAAQITSIPFENVLPFLGEVPDLGEDRLWRKLVLERKGGYCFELNALLSQALNALGFTNQRVLARVRMGDSEGGVRSHQAHVVTLDGSEWLLDAGFGGQAPASPVNLTTADEQPIRDQIYRMRFDAAESEEVLERKTSDGWVSLYGFDRQSPKQVDVEAANYLCAKWPKISFSSSMKFYRLTDNGWISFQNGLAGFTSNRVKTTRTIVKQSDLTQFMREDLGLGYGDDQIGAIAQRLAAMQDRDPIV
ncbi:MAG: arylamine N-acetyltransferase [Roseibium sp.]|uniref:arylamine N-acetyltransferase family protein n=1 Tax=Roseibium sp. TaxID=1936156 RepID=UPI0026378927|nr:arylamine N-acetyltransferase [Roseibium sp.]MCV0426600.1 arylamine N-acetyltransferase [Roseibium sp.]